jgi:hypothetical protein
MKKSSKLFFALKKNQNENLEFRKSIITQIDFSKSHIYRDVFKRFKLEAHELGYGKNLSINMI